MTHRAATSCTASRRSLRQRSRMSPLPQAHTRPEGPPAVFTSLSNCLSLPFKPAPKLCTHFVIKSVSCALVFFFVFFFLLGGVLGASAALWRRNKFTDTENAQHPAAATPEREQECSHLNVGLRSRISALAGEQIAREDPPRALRKHPIVNRRRTYVAGRDLSKSMRASQRPVTFGWRNSTCDLCC